MATPPSFNRFHGYSVPLYGVFRLEGKPVTICAFFFSFLGRAAAQTGLQKKWGIFWRASLVCQSRMKRLQHIMGQRRARAAGRV